MMFQRAVAPGIEMRQFRREDAEPAFAVVDRHRDYLRRWLPWVDGTRSAEDVLQFIGRTLDEFETNRNPQAGIWVDGVLSGSMGCHPIDWAHRNSSIGYWIRPDLQGRGIVTQCCEVMLDHLFKELGLHRVEIRCGTGNTRSCAVPARLGFTREGVAREAEWVSDRWIDLVIWSMLQEEWEMRRKPQAK
jgi:ribosomal-protein-serine acetyltransferase